MNEQYIAKLINLINRGLITVNDIKDEAYKAEIIKRLGA